MKSSPRRRGDRIVGADPADVLSFVRAWRDLSAGLAAPALTRPEVGRIGRSIVHWLAKLVVESKHRTPAACWFDRGGVGWWIRPTQVRHVANDALIVGVASWLADHVVVELHSRGGASVWMRFVRGTWGVTFPARVGQSRYWSMLTVALRAQCGDRLIAGAVATMRGGR